MARNSLSSGIDVARLDQVTKDLGVRVRVFKSTLCPNMTSVESDDHDITCTVCNHRMIDFDPECTYAIFQQQGLSEQFKVAGTFHIDEIMVTFLTGVTLHTMARVDLVDFAEEFFELKQRQVSTPVDKLKFETECVVAVFTVINNQEVRYHCGTDFKVNKDGNIEWISAHQPDPGQIYSIYYKHNPSYRAIKAVHRDRYSQLNVRNKDNQFKVEADGKTFIKLPETWILKRTYLAEKDDVNGIREVPDVYYDPNEP